MATPQSVIKKFMSVLDNTGYTGKSALSAAVKYVSRFSGWDSLRLQMVNDCAAYRGDWYGFLRDKCGIILGNDDNGAITGTDAGGWAVKTKSSVIPEDGYLRTLTSQNFTVNGLTVHFEKDLSAMTYYERYIANAMYTWWMPNALNLIEESYGLSFKSGSGNTVSYISVIFANEGRSGALASTPYNTSGGSTTKLSLKINTGYYGTGLNVYGRDGDSSSTRFFLDTTLTHEMVHSMMAANISYFTSLPNVFKEGSAELVVGIDDERYDDIRRLASSSSALRAALTSSTSGDIYAGGYMLLRYLAKQASGAYSGSNMPSVSSDPAMSYTVKVEDGEMKVTTSSARLQIFLDGKNPFTGAYSPYANSSVTTLTGTAYTSDFLGGNSRDNYIVSYGSDSLWGGSGGNDTLIGRWGHENKFFYASGNGNDTVENFQAGTGYDADVVVLYKGAGLNGINRDGGKIIFGTKSGGQLTVNTMTEEVDTAIKYSSNGSSSTNVKIGNTYYSNNLTYAGGVSRYYGGYGTDTLSVESSSSVNIKLSSNKFSSIEVIDASNSTGKNTLIGDSGQNTLTAGTGTNKLWGSSGYNNDTLIGNDGTDHFYYGKNQGDDVVQNAGSGDYVRLYNINPSEVTYSPNTDSGVKFYVGSGSLTIDKTDGVTFVFKGGARYVYDSYSENFVRTS